MTRGNIFWFLMLLWLVFGGLGLFGPGPYARWGIIGFDLLTFILIGLLGWKTYGPAIKGD